MVAISFSGKDIGYALKSYLLEMLISKSEQFVFVTKVT